MALNVLIKRHDKDIELPKRTAVGDWIDLRAAEEKHFKPGEYGLISLGVP